VDKGDREECVGFSCLGGFNWPDGGEIRIQYFLLPDGTEWTRMTVFFLTHSEPEINPLLPLGHCGQIDPTKPPIQGANREYVDVGDTVIVDLGDMQVTLDKIQRDDGMEVEDYIGRKHPFYYYKQITDPRPDEFFNAYHTVSIPGHPFDEYLQDHPIFVGSRGTNSEDGHTLELPQEGKLITWNRVEPFPDNIAHAGTLLWAVPGQLPVMCLTPDYGQYQMKPEDVDVIPGDSGLMLIGQVTNEAFLRPDMEPTRMVNAWGIYCHMHPFQKVY
jgi:hypothetical protein